MKSILILCSFLFVSLVSLGQNTSLSVTFKFIGIVDGYDHLCKTEVWLDGDMIGESPEVYESNGGAFQVSIPYGEHSLTVVNLAYYDGVWEEHTIENEYSIDCIWEGSHKFSKKSEKMFLLFDIDNGTTVSWKKMPKAQKA